MILERYIHRFERLDQLIRMEATGTPKMLADRLKISERILYDYLEVMRAMGAPIVYSRQKSSYIYTEKVKFFIGFYEDKMFYKQYQK